MKIQIRACALLLLGLLSYIIAPAQTRRPIAEAGYTNTSAEANSFSILSDGSLWAWGTNGLGQFGDGTVVSHTEPYQIGKFSQWRSIAPGLQHTAAVRVDGTLWTWGTNSSGQLGNGTKVASLLPVQISTDTTWVSVHSGAFFSLARRRDGSLWAWGTNSQGQLGDGTVQDRLTPTRIGGSASWMKIATGWNSILAIRTDGTLWGWGSNFYGNLGFGLYVNDNIKTPTQVGTASNWIDISADVSHSVGVRADGSLWSWGNNLFGQLGNGTTSQQYVTVPQRVGTGNNWATAAAGERYTLAIQQDGTMWGFGDNTLGQLGDGTDFSRLTPTQIGSIKTWTSVSAGSTHAVATRTDGSVWAWGPNSVGQVGSTAIIALASPLPRQVGITTNWAKVCTGNGQTLALRTDGSLWAWGMTSYGITGQVLYHNQDVPIQIGGSNMWRRISLGRMHAVALQQDSTLWTWGINQYGQLGNGLVGTSATVVPTQVGTSHSWVMIAAGNGHTVALRRDGTLWAWGLNSEGQLGDGTTVTRLSPVLIPRPAKAALNSVWTHVAVGDDFTLALRSDNTLWAWGRNSYYQLGDNTSITRLLPTQIGLEKTWAKLAGGAFHAEAIRQNGELWGWGENAQGQVGSSTVAAQPEPIQVGTSTNWLQVAASDYNTAAVRSDGTLWTWGSGANRQLGDGSTGNRRAPAQMGTITTWSSVDVGYSHSAAIRSDGTLWAWGVNGSGQLGIPSFTFVPLLIQFNQTPLAVRFPLATTMPLDVYPNPAHDFIQVKHATEPVLLLDIMGHFIRYLVGQEAISLSGLPAGVYIVRSGTRATRLVIQ